MPRGTKQMALGDTGRTRIEPAKHVGLQGCLGLEFSRYCQCVQQGAAGGAGISGGFICTFPNVAPCASLFTDLCLMLDCWKQVGCADAITKLKQLSSPSTKVPLTSLQLCVGQCPCSSYESLPVLVCLGGEVWIHVRRLLPWHCAAWVEQLPGESKRKSCEVERIVYREQGYWSATWVGLGKG